jgi:hypothetical protein
MDIISYGLIKKRVDQQLAENQNLYETAMSVLDPGAEVGAARISTVKNKTFEFIGPRFEELEADAYKPITNLINGKGDSLTGWQGLTGDLTVSGGFFVYAPTVAGKREYYSITAANGDKIYLRYKYKTVGMPPMYMSFRLFNGATQVTNFSSITPSADIPITESSEVITATGTVNSIAYRPFTATGGAGTWQFQYIVCLNLTQIFGLGKEPDSSLVDAFLSRLENKYFDGAINGASALKMYMEPALVRRQIIEKTGYGVFSGLGVTAQGTPNMTVAVAAGICYMQTGTRYSPIANAALAITSANVTNPRIDIVYVNSSGVIAYLSGAAAATPSAPALPTGGLLLAEISVAAGTTTIQSANITDCRKNLWHEAAIIATLVSSVTGTVRYSKSVTGVATVRVSVTSPAGGLVSSSLFATLASGYRPMYNSPFPLRNSTTGAVVYAYLGSNGELRNVDALSAGVTYTGTLTYLAA